MKLYNLPTKTWVRLQEDQQGPPGSPNFLLGEEFFFDHIDGMYSYCKDRNNNRVHLPAWSEVTPLDKKE
mgnify:FL=1